jgi:hypothetical protein
MLDSTILAYASELGRSAQHRRGLLSHEPPAGRHRFQTPNPKLTAQIASHPKSIEAISVNTEPFATVF